MTKQEKSKWVSVQGWMTALCWVEAAVGQSYPWLISEEIIDIKRTIMMMIELE